jgi:4-hydroxy-tetrahydrodipicolinate synthase
VLAEGASRVFATSMRGKRTRLAAGTTRAVAHWILARRYEGANFYPSPFVNLFDALNSGDTALAAELQTKLLKLGQIYSVGQHGSDVIKGMKCTCSLLGICDDLIAEPFERLRPAERARIKAVLESVSLLKTGTVPQR